MIVLICWAIFAVCGATLLEEFSELTSGCDLTISSVTVLNCDNSHLIYSTTNLLKYENKGVTNHGKNYKLGPVTKIVKKIYTGDDIIAIIDPVKNEGI